MHASQEAPPPDRSGWQGLAEWRGELGRRWAAASATVEEQFGRLGDATLASLGELSGRRVLDVGCGSGATTAALARLVGPAGSVTAIDPSAELLHQAAATCAGLEAELRGRLSLVEGDAQRHPFPAGAFDVVFSRLGVMFFEDPPAAFVNLRRATAAGGRLAFTCWPQRAAVPLLIAPLRALAGIVELPASAPEGSPNPFSLGDAAATTSLLAGAGWHHVRVHELRWPVELPADATEAAERWLRTMPVTVAVPNPDAATAARMVAALAAAVPPSRRMEQSALLVTASG